MAEWLKAHAWKACLLERVTWVRIPLSPPVFLACPGAPEHGNACRRASAGELQLSSQLTQQALEMRAWSKSRARSPFSGNGFLPAGDGSDNNKRLLSRRHGVGQGGIRRFVGQILFAREEPQERPAM